MAIQTNPGKALENDFFRTQAPTTAVPATQVEREFYIKQLGAAAGNKPLSQLRRDFLQQYVTSSANGLKDLWDEVTGAVNTKPINQVKREYYIKEMV